MPDPARTRQRTLAQLGEEVVQAKGERQRPGLGGAGLRVSHDGGEREIACDYLIACDGASSIVRRQLGITLGGSTFRERWLIVDLENSPVTSPHTKVFSNPARPCIALPGPDVTRRYEFMLHDGESDDE